MDVAKSVSPGAKRSTRTKRCMKKKTSAVSTAAKKPASKKKKMNISHSLTRESVVPKKKLVQGPVISKNTQGTKEDLEPDDRGMKIR